MHTHQYREGAVGYVFLFYIINQFSVIIIENSRFMCDSNQPFPIPLLGKGGDITRKVVMSLGVEKIFLVITSMAGQRL